MVRSIGNAPVYGIARGWVQPDDAAQRRRDPDRSALVAAEGQVDLTGGEQRAASARRSARFPCGVPWVAHRPAGRGEAGSRAAQILADGFAGDRCPGGKQPLHDGGVPAGDETLHRAGSVHHRNPGDRDVVLDRHRPAGERPLSAGADLGGDIPGAQRVVARLGEPVGAFRGLGARERVVELVDRVVGPQ